MQGMPMFDPGDTMPTVEAQVIITLAPVQEVPEEQLEATTLHVEAVLDEHAGTIAPGAGASTNLEANTIEIDALIEAVSPAELYKKMGQIMDVLVLHSALNICEAPNNQLAMQSSSTHVTAPAPLVPA